MSEPRPNNPEAGASPADDDDFDEQLRDAVNEQLGEPPPMGKAKKKPLPPKAPEPKRPRPKAPPPAPKPEPPAKSKHRLPPPGDPLRYVYRPKDRCRLCRSDNLKTYRSTRHPDGVIERRTICRDCGYKFILVLE
jgi:hypothetical protein